MQQSSICGHDDPTKSWPVVRNLGQCTRPSGFWKGTESSKRPTHTVHRLRAVDGQSRLSCSCSPFQLVQVCQFIAMKPHIVTKSIKNVFIRLFLISKTVGLVGRCVPKSWREKRLRFDAEWRDVRKLGHCPYAGGASPKPGRSRRATSMILSAMRWRRTLPW